jgi:hypothetical protein
MQTASALARAPKSGDGRSSEVRRIDDSARIDVIGDIPCVDDGLQHR